MSRQSRGQPTSSRNSAIYEDSDSFKYVDIRDIAERQRKIQRMSMRNSALFDDSNAIMMPEAQPLQRMSMVEKPQRVEPQPERIHKSHSCTDVHCLLLFACAVVAWFYIAHYALTNGDLNKVLIPTDSNNRKCGYDSGVKNKPYLFFFDLLKCADAMTPLTGCQTKQICVEKCPEQTFYWQGNEKAQDLEGIKQQIICEDGVDVNAFRRIEDVSRAIDDGRCSGSYFESQPIFNRCVPFPREELCSLVPDAIRERKRRELAAKITANPNGHELQSMALVGLEDIKKNFFLFKNSTKAFCAENNKKIMLLKNKAEDANTGLTRIIAAILSKFTNENSENVAEYIKKDLKASWKVVAIAFILHIVIVLIFITLLRWVAKPLIWISICGVIVGLVMMLLHSMQQYMFFRNSPQTPLHHWHLKAQLENILKNDQFWLYLSVVTGAILTIIVLIVIVIRKRISIAIAIVKEASKAITSIKSSIFFPLFPGFLYIIVTLMAGVVFLYLGSVGSLTYRKYNQFEASIGSRETCTCTGEALNYTLGGICDPVIFESNCFISGTRKPCLETVCRFVEIKHNATTQWYIYFNVFVFFWVTFFIAAYGEMVLASTFAMWYWTFDKKDLTSTPLLKAMGRTTIYHLGTIAFGSLILSICRMIRWILELMEKKLKLYDNAVVKAILCCMKCFFWLLENFLRFLNRNAYIMCAVHSTSFCASSRKAFALITQNILRVFAIDNVSNFLFFLSKLLLTGCTSFITYLLLITYPGVIPITFPLVPVSLVAILGYVLADVIFSTYSMAVDTLFFCFLEDSSENDGSTAKPFYMSKELRRLLGKKIQKKKTMQ
ncbi:choline transporter-like 2 [Stomoxys calcitrans]|uniref:choline transporter-like 2 n=1 Tax=Stomoxys calcitrans TaxID=35570 RepID=UPI0027E37247|nr:choline transporter-like 2 [Stomoxys calcitrans]